MKAVVTGGAGFIGSNLVDALIARGDSVLVLDSLVTGKKEFLKQHEGNKRLSFKKFDLVKPDFDGLLSGYDTLFHLAASVEVKRSTEDPQTTYDNNVLATYNVLEAARKSGIKTLAFSSSVTVFGEAKKIPTPEDYGPLRPISIYGASKLACEAMVSAYANLYGFNAVVYRFANIIGTRGTHGVIRDFILKLRATPNRLEILGNGKQNKSYLHVTDCVNALLLCEKAAKPFDCLHVGSEDSTTVNQIANTVVEEMKLSGVEFAYTGGERGWPGDLVRSQLDVTKLKKLGWRPNHNSSQAVRMAVKEVLKQI